MTNRRINLDDAKASISKNLTEAYINHGDCEIILKTLQKDIDELYQFHSARAESLKQCLDKVTRAVTHLTSYHEQQKIYHNHKDKLSNGQ
jgi:SPX domain protein involved in polyphosphate accumulation